jgi:hypothetical protein
MPDEESPRHVHVVCSNRWVSEREAIAHLAAAIREAVWSRRASIIAKAAVAESMD